MGFSNVLGIVFLCSSVGAEVTYLAFFKNDFSDWYMYAQTLFHTIVVFLKKWA